MERHRKRARLNYLAATESSNTSDNIPDVYGQRWREKEKLKEELQQNPDNDEFEDLNLPVTSDTLAAAQYLINNQLPTSEKNKHLELVRKFPRICFVHQIYSMLSDNTAVDRELQQAIDEGSWRKFHISGSLEDEYAVMNTKDYVTMIDEAKMEFREDSESSSKGPVDPNVFDRFKSMVLDRRFGDVAVSHRMLCSDEYYRFSDVEIKHLVMYGLLLPHLQPDLYWFSIRRQGLFMSHYTKGRAEILRMLKRRPTKDLLEKQLKERKLHKTVFSHEFLLHDIVGSGRAERHKTTMGDLIRLTKKGEQGQ